MRGTLVLARRCVTVHDAPPNEFETPRQKARQRTDVAIALLANNRGAHSLVLVKTMRNMASEYSRTGYLADARDLLRMALDRAKAPLQEMFDAADAGHQVSLSAAERVRWDVVLELLQQRSALSRSVEESTELQQKVYRYGQAVGSSSPVVQDAARALRDSLRVMPPPTAASPLCRVSTEYDRKADQVSLPADWPSADRP